MNAVVNGVLTHYEAAGDTKLPVALLLHGWAADVNSLAGLAVHLQGRYRVVRVDLPGFGGSERPPADWHIVDYARFIRDFAAKIGVKKIGLLIGHSFGGRITIKAVASGVLAPQKIVLLGSGGIQHSHTVRNQAYKILAKTGKLVTALPGLRQFRSALRGILYESAGSTDYLRSGEMKQIFLHSINEDLRGDATKITIPALLIWGEGDDQTPPADGKLLAQAIPGAQLHIIKNAGHYVQLDAPAEVAALIDAFIT
jgi:pimeloyl-ACP methyl ester carboxylesterase